MVLAATTLKRPPLPAEVFEGMMEFYEDNPTNFATLAELFSRAGRPQFGSVEVCFERGRVTVVREHRTHK